MNFVPRTSLRWALESHARENEEIENMKENKKK